MTVVIGACFDGKGFVWIKDENWLVFIISLFEIDISVHVTRDVWQCKLSCFMHNIWEIMFKEHMYILQPKCNACQFSHCSGDCGNLAVFVTSLVHTKLCLSQAIRSHCKGEQNYGGVTLFVRTDICSDSYTCSSCSDYFTCYLWHMCIWSQRMVSQVTRNKLLYRSNVFFGL